MAFFYTSREQRTQYLLQNRIFSQNPLAQVYPQARGAAIHNASAWLQSLVQLWRRLCRHTRSTNPKLSQPTKRKLMPFGKLNMIVDGENAPYSSFYQDLEEGIVGYTAQSSNLKSGKYKNQKVAVPTAPRIEAEIPIKNRLFAGKNYAVTTKAIFYRYWSG